MESANVRERNLLLTMAPNSGHATVARSAHLSEDGNVEL
jgi:hypothetical protein